MKIVKREEIKVKQFVEMLKLESHHEHEIITSDDGILHWKPNQRLSIIIHSLNINQIVTDFLYAGIGKNHEAYRKFYRDIGYSLNGYWEIFYFFLPCFKSCAFRE